MELLLAVPVNSEHFVPIIILQHEMDQNFDKMKFFEVIHHFVNKALNQMKEVLHN